MTNQSNTNFLRFIIGGALIMWGFYKLTVNSSSFVNNDLEKKYEQSYYETSSAQKKSLELVGNVSVTSSGRL